VVDNNDGISVRSDAASYMRIARVTARNNNGAGIYLESRNKTLTNITATANDGSGVEIEDEAAVPRMESITASNNGNDGVEIKGADEGVPPRSSATSRRTTTIDTASKSTGAT
jgi:hypothetical protein